MNFLKTTFLSVLALVATLGLAQAAPKIGYPGTRFQCRGHHRQDLEPGRVEG